MITAGIDVGITGGVAVIDEHGGCESILMPVIDDVVDGAALLNFLQERNVSFVTIEKVHAMPGNGVTSMFNFGYSAGIARAVAQIICCQPRMVTPQAWKKHFGLIGAEKDASRKIALDLFPRAAQQFARKKDTGRAEASLIAAFHLGMHLSSSEERAA